MSKLGKLFLFVFMLLCVSSYTYASKPASFVDITRPANNFTTAKNTLTVTVAFGPYRSKHKHTQTKLIILKIDNIKVAAYDVPKKDKDGSHNFSINISSYSEGSHILKAYAYKDKKGKHQIAQSSPVVFIIKRNSPPQITSNPVTNAKEGQPYSYQMIANDPDASDILIYSLTTAPVNMIIDSVSGLITWLPTYEQAGNADVIVKVTDKGGLCVTQAFTIIVENVNRPPMAIIQSSQTSVKVGANVTLDGIGSSDPDGDILTYHWSLVSKPENSIITIPDTNVSQVSFVPDQPGAYMAQLIVTDPSNAASQSVTVTIQATPTDEPIPTPQSGFIHGQVFDANNDLPLAGATITIEGITGIVLTNGQGKFSFPTPGTGDFDLTYNKPGYLYAQRKARVISTRNTAVDDVYLKPLDPAVTEITNAGGTHTNYNGKIILTIPPNALPQGTTSILAQATLYEHSKELPAPLPKTSFYTYCIDLEPEGTQFSQSVSVKFANDLGFAPGTLIPIGLYNSNIHKWEDTGLKGTVSQDGLWVEFEVTHFSPWDINFPPPPPQQRLPNVTNQTSYSNNNSKVCAKNSGNSIVRLKTGELSIDHSLPSFKTLNRNSTLTFFYNSYSANPMSIIAADTDINTSTTIVPVDTTFKLNIEGLSTSTYFKGVAGKARQAYLYPCSDLNNNKLATGSYPYTMEISNNYINLTYQTANFFGGPPTGNTGIVTREPVSYTTNVTGRIVVNNQQNSPFGSGWSLNGLQRLYFDPDGAILLTEGEGSAKTFIKGITKGIPNLVVANSGTNTISVLAGDGQGGFLDQRTYNSGASPYAIASGDFNNDGCIDLAVANNSIDTISILLGSKEGVLRNAKIHLMDNSIYHNWLPFSMVTGDFNKDGILDLAVVSKKYSRSGGGTGNWIDVLLGQGDGTFIETYNYQLGYWFPASSTFPAAIKTTDFNQDGVGDLVVIAPYNLLVFLGTGDGSFAPPYSVYSRAGNGPRGITVDDFNNDSFTDIAAQDYDGIHILLGDGNGGVNNTVLCPISGNLQYEGLASADFNHDGFKDVVVTEYNGNRIFVILGNGDGTFKDAGAYPVGATPIYMQAGDYNRDSYPDLAITTYMANQVAILLGNGDGSFQESVLYPVGSVPNKLLSFSSNYDAYYPPDGDYSHIIRNQDESFTRIMKDGAKINFSQSGWHTSTIDKNGNTTTFTYTDTDNNGTLDVLSSISLPTGQAYQFTYANSKLTQISDPAGRITRFTIDANGDLSQITNADNTNRYFTYNTNHLMTKKTDEKGNSTEYFYDNHGAIREIHSPQREVTEIAPNGSVFSSIQTEIRKYYPSNIKGLINDLPIGVGTEQNPADVIQPQDMPEQMTDGKGNSWTYHTDKFGGRMQFVDPIGNTINYERDANSNLKKLTRAEGSIVEMSYDDQGNLTLINENTNSAQAKIKYDPIFSQPVSITDPKDNSTLINYDAQGNPIKITDAQGIISIMECNAKGQVTKAISAFGTPQQNEITFTYDPITFNLSRINNPLNHSTSFIYNSAGNIEKITDANNKSAQFTYDPMNRVKTVTDTDSKVTTYDYDKAGNLISITDANNHTTTFTYDEQNQLVKTTNPLNEARIYSYDINRNLSLVVTPNGAEIKLYNNPANLVEKKFLPEGEVDYTYDSEYNLTQVVDANSDLSFTYDPLSRLIQSQTTGPVQPATSISYAYDLNSNLTSMTDPAGIVTHYVYDTLSRLTKITDVNGIYISSYTYDGLSRRTSKIIPNGSTPLNTSYTYDIASQLKSITNMPANINNYYDSYDNVGNRLGMTDSNGIHSYSYDNVYRLTNSSNPNETYSYDPVGNRNPLINNYDNTNRLKEDNENFYTYDNNGNRISRSSKATGAMTNYTYNSEDQLIGVIMPSQTISYKYDALCRRIEKNVGGTITRYIYDGEDIIQELDENNNLITTYIHGPSIDEPILVEKNGQKYYYISDGLGSITAIIDQSGNIAQMYRYDSFGNIVNSSGTITQPFTYTGREYDSETGLYYYRARYYDPKIGRFLQEDPIGFSGGINFYAYVGNNPLNLVDPWGLWYIDINISGGYWFGGTGGVIINNEGLYPYVGGGVVTPGIGGSITWSSSNPTTGWNVGLQGQAGIAGQFGYGFGEDGGWFWEVGGGWPPGASLTGYYVFGPYFGPCN